MIAQVRVSSGSDRDETAFGDAKHDAVRLKGVLVRGGDLGQSGMGADYAGAEIGARVGVNAAFEALRWRLIPEGCDAERRGADAEAAA